MNYAVGTKITIRFFILMVCGAHLSSYAMQEAAAHTTENVFELHPLFAPDMNMQRHALMLPDCYERYKKHNGNIITGFDADTDRPYLLNTNCTLGVLSVLMDDGKSALQHFQEGGKQESSLSKYYEAMMHMIGYGTPFSWERAENLFQEAEKASKKIVGIDPNLWPKHLMGISGIAPSEKYNAMVMFDKMLFEKTDLPKGYFPYLISSYAHKKNDAAAEELCLLEAIKHENAFLPYALHGLGALCALRNETEQAKHYFERSKALNPSAVSSDADNASSGSRSSSALNTSEGNASIKSDESPSVQQTEISVTQKTSKSNKKHSHQESSTQNTIRQSDNDKGAASCVEQQTSRKNDFANQQTNNAFGHNGAAQTGSNYNNRRNQWQQYNNEQDTRTHSNQNSRQQKDNNKNKQGKEASHTPHSYRYNSFVPQQTITPIEASQASQATHQASSSGSASAESVTPAIADIPELPAEQLQANQALRNGAKNPIQKMALLTEHGKKGDQNALYEHGVYHFDNLIDNISDKDKSRTVKGLDLFKQAMYRNHPLASYEYVIRGFKLDDAAQRDVVAAEADRLFLRMDKIDLDAEKKKEMYAAAGSYALKKKDAEKARKWLQQAFDLGSADNAYDLGVLWLKQNEYGKALRSFSAVQKEKQNQVEWNKTLIAYEMSQDEQEKKNLLAQLREPLRKTSDIFLSDADMLQVIQRDTLNEGMPSEGALEKLQQDAQRGNALALFLAGYFIEKIQATNGQERAFELYKKAITDAAGDQELVDACVFHIRALAENKCMKADEYVRKHCAVAEEKEVEALYALIAQSNNKLDITLPQCSANAVKVLERDAKADKKEACMALGLRLLAGNSRDVSSLEKALAQFENAEKLGVDVKQYKSNTLLALANAAKNEAERNKLYKRAADLGNDVACYTLYTRYTAKQDADNAVPYLQQALSRDYIPAHIEVAMREYRQIDQDPAALQKTKQHVAGIDVLLARMGNDALDKSEAMRLYEIKAGLCRLDSNDAESMLWLRKSVEAGSSTGALTVALDWLEQGKYAEAHSAIEKIVNDDRKSILASYAGYKLASGDTQREKYNSFVDNYILHLKQAWWEAVNQMPNKDVKKLKSILQNDEALVRGIKSDMAKRDKKAIRMFILSNGCGAGIPDDQIHEYVKQLKDVDCYEMLAQAAVKRKNYQRAFDVLAEGLANETCQSCHSYGRNYLARILGDMVSYIEKGEVETLKMTRAIPHLEKVYAAIQSNDAIPSVNDKPLLTAIRHFLCQHYFEEKNANKLYEWYGKEPKSQDGSYKIPELRYQALLHEHNKFNKREPKAAGDLAIKCWQEAATLGDPTARERLVSLASRKQSLACGAIVQGRVPSVVLDYAYDLCMNSNTPNQIRAEAARVLGNNAKSHLEKMEDADEEKQLEYNTARMYYSMALQNGCYAVLPDYLSMCKDMEDGETLNDVYETYRNESKGIVTELRVGVTMLMSNSSVTRDLIVGRLIPLMMHKNGIFDDCSKEDLDECEQALGELSDQLHVLPINVDRFMQECGFANADELLRAKTGLLGCENLLMSHVALKEHLTEGDLIKRRQRKNQIRESKKVFTHGLLGLQSNKSQKK